ncbi:MAG: DUF1501 domain-containing protein [Planctomycetota bacterium]
MSTFDFRRLCRRADAPTRRQFVSSLARGLLGVTAAGFATRVATAARPDRRLQPLLPVHTPRGRARQVIYLFLRGGMSQIDTLDPKPGQKTQGPTEALRTRADGVLVGQHLPLLALQLDKACIVRSMTSTQGAHAQAQYLMRTGYEKRGTIQHPSLGAWTSMLQGRQNATLPGHVLLGGGGDMPTAGFLPPQFAALPIGDPQQGLQNARLADGVDAARFQRRLDLLAQMDAEFGSDHPHRDVAAYGEAYADAVRLMRSDDLTAFDIDREDDAMRDVYGRTPFGAGCLLARRLVEHGVRYCEVVSDGWDTHADNFDRLADLLPAIDRGLAALLADLDARGLLQETLVVLATEFGRTPDIDEDQGRNHYPKVFSCLLAGGGVRGGRAYGSTDAEGREVAESPVTIPDLNATIAFALGLPLDQTVTSPSGRPFTVADKGEPIHELF